MKKSPTFKIRNAALGDRIFAIRELVYETQQVFSEGIGIGYPSLRQLEGGQIEDIRGEVLLRIGAVHGFALEWVVRGKGEVFSGLSINDFSGKESPNECFLKVYDHFPLSKSSPVGFIPKPGGFSVANCFGYLILSDAMAPRYREGEIVLCAYAEDLPFESETLIKLRNAETLLRIWRDTGTDDVELASCNSSVSSLTIPRKSLEATAAVVFHYTKQYVAEQLIREHLPKAFLREKPMPFHQAASLSIKRSHRITLANAEKLVNEKADNYMEMQRVFRKAVEVIISRRKLKRNG